MPLVGGHPALDLVNSLERGVPRPDRANQDFLVDPAAGVAWAARAGLLPDAATPMRCGRRGTPIPAVPGARSTA